MSMRSLESAMLAELREVCQKRSIRLKDVMEWSTGNVTVHEPEETRVFLPGLKIHVALMTEALGKSNRTKGVTKVG